MRISVTGANGFLGTKLVKLLDSQGHHVIAWMREPPMSGYHKDCRAFDLEQCNINLDDSDVLIHCAAYLPANFGDVSEAEKCLQINGIGTLRLLQAAEQSRVKKFVHLSTGQIYSWKGPTSEAVEDDKMDQIERATPYLVSKWVGDTYVRAHKGNMKTVVLRPSYIYGPGMKSAGLLHRITAALKFSDHIDMHKMGNYNVDLVYVDDVARMTATCATTDVTGVYNVGGGSAVSTRTLVHSLASAMGKSVDTTVEPLELDRCHPALNIAAATRVGYRTTSLLVGLINYVESLR